MRLQMSAEQQARQRNLYFLAQPHLWPAWPLLPLVRRKPDQEQECGLLYDIKGVYGMLGYSATIWLCNIFQTPPTLEEFLALPKETFDTPEEIVDAGWRID
jgi:hypothetical protein